MKIWKIRESGEQPQYFLPFWFLWPKLAEILWALPYLLSPLYSSSNLYGQLVAGPALWLQATFIRTKSKYHTYIYLEARSLYVVLCVLELTVWTRLTLNSQRNILDTEFVNTVIVFSLSMVCFSFLFSCDYPPPLLFWLLCLLSLCPVLDAELRVLWMSGKRCAASLFTLLFPLLCSFLVWYSSSFQFVPWACGVTRIKELFPCVFFVVVVVLWL